MAPADRFASLVQGPEDEIALDEAALLIAAHGDPGLDVAAALAGIDAIAARATDPSAAAVAALLFGQLGLRGNREDYGDPRNSYLHLVLGRGLGIPISLALAVIVVGRRLDVPFAGIGMPGHFLLHDGHTFLDPFDGGRRLDEEGCAALYHRLFGPQAAWSPALLAPVGHRALLARMLANLRQSFAARGERDGLAWSTQLAVTIPGRPPAEVAELAQALARLGRFHEAADALEGLADSASVPSPERDRLRSSATSLRARLN